MDEATKRVLDVIATYAALLGASVGFFYTILTWRRGQAWQRADKLDKLIESFESSDLLQFACVLLDWTWRTTTFRGRTIVFTSDDVIAALRTATDFGSAEKMNFPDDQPVMREAFDAFLSFLCRLEVALRNDLIPEDATKSHFSYWVERFTWMDRHDHDGTGKGARAALKYVKAYGFPEVVDDLRRRLDIDLQAPAPDSDRTADDGVLAQGI
ncbi:MAG TPA: hypothetical protein VKQ32_15005 [Polyangia bacterium]|nr:hypothetical protein [Polyangia bacterium]